MSRQLFKGMKNALYCITPHNERVDIFCRSVQLINEFAKLGFDNRSQFINVVQETDPETFSGYKMGTQLQHFYIMRKFDESIIADLEKVLEKLKSE